MSTSRSAPDAGWHLLDQTLARYSSSVGAGLAGAWLISVEAHLDNCAACRLKLTPPPADLRLLDEMGAQLVERTRNTRQYRRPPGHWIRLVTSLPLPWLLATIAAVATAAGLDVLVRDVGDSRPPLLLLLAPVLPLVAVAAAWTPLLDPMHEVTASTPAAGLAFLLRRTVMTLLPVVLASAACSAFGVAAPPTLWLLPCLALTTAALALGSIVRLSFAAAAVLGGWTATVLAPSLGHAYEPVLLTSAAQPLWLALLIGAGASIGLRRSSYQRFSAIS